VEMRWLCTTRNNTPKKDLLAESAASSSAHPLLSSHEATALLHNLAGDSSSDATDSYTIHLQQAKETLTIDNMKFHRRAVGRLGHPKVQITLLAHLSESGGVVSEG
jgi:hypothetical protein